VIYLQGILLALVCLGSFTIGLLVGSDASPTPSPEQRAPQPSSISGSIRHADEPDRTVPDPGAVAIAVPRDLRPEQKIQIVGLRPQDPPPAEDDEAVQAIRRLGGDYARADAEGRYRLRLPDRGTYFLLFISAAASRGDRPPSKTQLAQIGRFFLLSPQLLDGHAFVWQEELIRGDRELEITFP
jgi:hypothetical protein